jgi:hypothetical protein
MVDILNIHLQLAQKIQQLKVKRIHQNLRTVRLATKLMVARLMAKPTTKQLLITPNTTASLVRRMIITNINNSTTSSIILSILGMTPMLLPLLKLLPLSLKPNPKLLLVQRSKELGIKGIQK